MLTTILQGMECPDNSDYRTSMPLDVPTCQNPDGLYEVSRGTGEGCACDQGYIKDAQRCVLIDDCGCFYENIYLKV